MFPSGHHDNRSCASDKWAAVAGLDLDAFVMLALLEARAQGVHAIPVDVIDRARPPAVGRPGTQGTRMGSVRDVRMWGANKGAGFPAGASRLLDAPLWRCFGRDGMCAC